MPKTTSASYDLALVKRYLQDQNVASGMTKSVRFCVKRYARKFVIEEGLMYYIMQTKESAEKREKVKKRLVCIADDEKQRALRASHDSLAHPGINSTRVNVSDNYY